METFRIREYKHKSNLPYHHRYHLEMVTEHSAACFADIDTDWIYFQAELTT